MIEVKNLYKNFDEIEVLKDISTVFEDGKTNLIIGQSGSGKTVLMKNLVGLLEHQRPDLVRWARLCPHVKGRESTHATRDGNDIPVSSTL